MRRNKGLILIVLIVLITLSGWVMFYRLQSSSRNASVIASIVTSCMQTYGTQTKVIQVSIPQKEYMVIWEDGTDRHASLWIDGIWVEIAREPLQQ